MREREYEIVTDKDLVPNHHQVQVQGDDQVPVQHMKMLLMMKAQILQE